MGPAPAVADVRAAVRRAIVDLQGPIFVACSGGADSMALAAATAFEAARAGVRAGLVTIDHGLQAGSDARARWVAALGSELGLDPVVVVPVAVGAVGGPEAAARAARYAALDALAAAHDAVVLLGHTRDDQAETVLLGLARGSGPRSVAGMRGRTGVYLRPLLDLPRDTTRAACDALGLDVWDDPHNADPRYRRVRVRQEVLPLLEDVLDGGAAAALARTAALLRDDLDALDDWAARVAVTALVGDGHGGPDLDVAVVAALPRAVRSRVLRSWLAGLGAGSVPAGRTDAVDALVTSWHGQGDVQVGRGVAVRRVAGRLTPATSALSGTPPASALSGTPPASALSGTPPASALSGTPPASALSGTPPASATLDPCPNSTPTSNRS